jgi:transposase-like protein
MAKTSAGRQPDPSSKSGQIRELLASGMSVADIAKKVGCSANLVYNVKARQGGGKKRGPGRPPKAKAAATTAPALDTIEGIVAAVKSSEQQRARLRGALERIQALVADALA